MNRLKTTLLLGLLTALIVIVGNLLGGRQGMMVALALAAVMNFASFWFSDKIVLFMSRAQEMKEQNDPVLFHAYRAA